MQLWLEYKIRPIHTTRGKDQTRRPRYDASLDMFWKSQSCIYNYKDNLSTTTNRSYTEIQE